MSPLTVIRTDAKWQVKPIWKCSWSLHISLSLFVFSTFFKRYSIPWPLFFQAKRVKKTPQIFVCCFRYQLSMELHHSFSSYRKQSVRIISNLDIAFPCATTFSLLFFSPSLHYYFCCIRNEYWRMHYEWAIFLFSWCISLLTALFQIRMKLIIWNTFENWTGNQIRTKR